MRARGFTLIEVLIALAVVAVALPALVMRVQSVSDNVGYIEEKTFAYWVAQNRMEELLIDYQLRKQFPKTKVNDRVEFGGKEWYWEVEAETTAMEGMYRMIVRVGDNEKDITAIVSGFVREEKKEQTVVQ
ncbi:type II secretion system protein I (GspI) [Alteromonadaceae bacterium Bs31]|nr:type II secretion system protein I (GspI) [Alteromonadaceae bacterium Bs31]